VCSVLTVTETLLKQNSSMNMQLHEVKTRDGDLDSNKAGICFDINRYRIYAMIRASVCLCTA